MNRVSVKSSAGRIFPTTTSAPGFCSPIALSIPVAVSYTRCAGLPSRGASVVPLSTTAPTCRLEKPSTRVYSSPKPTQPDNSTSGVASLTPHRDSASEGSVGRPATGAGVWAAEFMPALWAVRIVPAGELRCST